MAAEREGDGPGGLRGLTARRRTMVWLALALAAEAGIALADLATPGMAVVATLVLVPPLVLAMVAGPRATAVVALVAVALGAANGFWNDNLGSAQWVLRLMIVTAAGGAAVIFAAVRERFAANDRRLRVLAGIGGAADGTLALDDALARMSELIVPAFADVCGWGVSEGGRARRVAMRIAGPGQGRERVLEELPPADPDLIADPRLYARLSESDLRDIAGPERAPVLSAIGLRSAITVPLRARGRHLGALYLGVGPSGRSYRPTDLEFATLMAGRAALALDNAGLFAEVVQLERERAAVLDSLADAVTVQDQSGRVVYANQAAARLLGLPSPQAVVDAEPASMVGRFEMTDDAGQPVSGEQLPGRRVLAGEEPEPLLVRVVELAGGVERWQVVKATPLRDATGRVTHAVNVMQDITEAKHAERAQRLLARAGVALASSLDYEQTLEQVARMAVGELCDWCSVDMVGEHEYLTRVAAAHRDPDRVNVAWELDRRFPTPLAEPAGLARVVRTGEPLLLPHVDDAALIRYAQDAEHLELLRRIGLHALMAVPMTVGGRTFGVLTFAAAESRGVFDADDLAVAEELGRRAALAVENARAYRVRAEIAATLQASLLPGDLPVMDGWRAAALYRAAGEANDVGGDLYDAFEVPDGWLLVIGDVTGKGAHAAALTALVRYAIRALGDIVRTPSGLLQRVNQLLFERAEMSLCTAACVRIDGKSEALFGVAGHPRPLILRADGGVEAVETTGALLGAFADRVAEDVSATIEPGEGIVLYTDGVLDAWGPGERFGEQRLIAVLREAERSPEGVIAAVAAALDAFQHGPQRDDTAVLAVFRDP